MKVNDGFYRFLCSSSTPLPLGKSFFQAIGFFSLFGGEKKKKPGEKSFVLKFVVNTKLISLDGQQVAVLCHHEG
jgi:hypothetical protein